MAVCLRNTSPKHATTANSKSKDYWLIVAVVVALCKNLFNFSSHSLHLLFANITKVDQTYTT